MANDNGKGKVYHVSKREKDKMWCVKAEGSEKVIKTFRTKEAAETYIKGLSERQNAGFVMHKSKGENKGKPSTTGKKHTPKGSK